MKNRLVRMKKFAYKPYPVRRPYIPKGYGKMRNLGIPLFEDKVAQGVFKEILEAIYEPKLKEFSFGFRLGRSCHDAIQKVNKHIMADKNFIRYTKRFLIHGVMEDGKRLETGLRIVQGGLISLVLANVYLHYISDT